LFSDLHPAKRMFFVLSSYLVIVSGREDKKTCCSAHVGVPSWMESVDTVRGDALHDGLVGPGPRQDTRSDVVNACTLRSLFRLLD
jgi:hypothetical protein